MRHKNPSNFLLLYKGNLSPWLIASNCRSKNRRLLVLETPATQTAVKQEPADSVDEEVPAKRSRQAEPTPPTEEPEAEADQQEPEDFGEAVFADDTQKVLLYESLKHPGEHK